MKCPVVSFEVSVGLVWLSVQFSSVQSLSRVRLFATPWIAAHQDSWSITNSQSSLRFKSIESVMPSSHLILCRPLLLLAPTPPSIRVFSNESTLRIGGQSTGLRATCILMLRVRELAWYALFWNLLVLGWSWFQCRCGGFWLSSCRLMFPGVRSFLVFSENFGFKFWIKPPASGFQSYSYSSLKTSLSIQHRL